MKIVVNEFKGIMPKFANDKLPENMAQIAQDCRTSSGEIISLKKSTAAVELDESSYESLFEYYESSTNHWIAFPGTVYGSRTMIADDTFERMYYMGKNGQTARGTITFTDGMTDGETFTVGAQTFEFDTADDGVGGGNSEISTATTPSAATAAAAVVAQAVPSAAVTFTDNGDGSVAVTANSHGTAGNSIVLTEVGAHITVDGAGTLGGTLVGYDDDEYRAFANDLVSTPFDQFTDNYQPGYPTPAAPVVPAGGGATYIAYFYTYVSRYGEEGEGSAIASIETYTVGSRQQVNTIATPPSGHGLVTGGTADPVVRVYRTADDGAGGSEFLMVCEAQWFSASDTYVQGDYVVYSNDLWECTNAGGHGPAAWNPANFTQGEDVAVADLESVTNPTYLWRACPDGTTNLRSHPNGFFCCSKGNRLLMSEPFYPHAWPEDYEISIDAQIVGLGIFGSTIVVATDAHLYTFSGPHPDSMYKQKGPFQPCLSQRGVVETDLGVMFPSKEGFQMVNAESAPSNITADTFDPDDWDDYELETLHGVWYNKAYYGFYKSTSFEGNIKIDFINGSITTGGDYHYAAYVSIDDGIFRTIVDSSIINPSSLYISQWDADPTRFRNYQYKSKRYVTQKAVNFAVAQVIIDLEWYEELLVEAGGDLEALNATTWTTTSWGYQMGGPINDWEPNEQDINGDDLYSLASLGIQSYVDFKVYVAGVLKFTKQVSTCDAFKLPRGFKNKQWEWEVVGMIPVKRVSMASSMEELKHG